MSVNVSASPYFICLSTTGPPLLMSYDQATGLFFPSHFPMVTQQPFEWHWLQGAKQAVTTKNPDIPSTGFKFTNPKFCTPQTADKQKDSKSQSVAEAHIDQESSEAGSDYDERLDIQKAPRRKKSGTQNQNRNIIPNIIQQIFSYLSKSKKSRPLCQRIFRVQQTEETSKFSVNRFYVYHKLFKDSMNHYVNQNTLDLFKTPNPKFLDVFPQEEQLFYLKVTRIMVSFFLNNICPLLTVKSKRMGKEKRIEHLRARRLLLTRLAANRVH